MKRIPLSRGQYAIIDEFDFLLVSRYKWSFDPKGYAFRNNGKRPYRRIVYMHRELLDAKKGEYCDHINGDKLDNRRSNLRICTNAQNIRNRKKGVNNTSGYKGIFWNYRYNKWYVQITVDGKRIYCGCSKSKEEAASMYNAKAKIYHGEFALLNSL